MGSWSLGATNIRKFFPQLAFDWSLNTPGLTSSKDLGIGRKGVTALNHHLDHHLFSGLTLRPASASQQVFPVHAFNFGAPPQTIVASNERLIALDVGCQLVSDYLATETPLRLLISGTPFSGKTSLGHEFVLQALARTPQMRNNSMLLYESAFERSPMTLARSLVHKATNGAEIPLETSLDVLLAKLVENTRTQQMPIIFLDDLYSAHAEFVNTLLLNAEDSNLQIFLSAMPDLERTLKRRYHHTFKRQIDRCRVVLPDFDVIALAAVIKQEAADLFDVPLTTEQALFFAEVDQVLTAKLPVSYGTDRPFVTILGKLADYHGQFLSGHDCRKITAIAAIYEDFIDVLNISKDAASVLKKVLKDLKLSDKVGKCFIDKADIFYYFEEDLVDALQIPKLEKQYAFGRILEELEEVGSVIPSEHLSWRYFCYYDAEDALSVLDARFPSS